MAGIAAMVKRDSSTVSSSATFSSRFHGRPMPVSCFPIIRVAPSDSTVNTTITVAAARTTRSRHMSTAATTTMIHSGQPK
ncbi:hypothetical protein RMO66_00940 [Nocardia seriolae]|nr:hypothetical protein [Nocardia seriolae]WNJ59461.1 hypothetical protein RMO66_00940 [Nocardia seriolae]